MIGSADVDPAVSHLLRYPSATLTAALDRFGPRLAVGSRLVTLGDSTTIAGENPATFTFGNSYGFFVELFAGQRIRHVRNAGIGGNTSAMVLARFDADVAPYRPTVVSLLVGVNDSFLGVPDADFRANVTALVARIRAIEATPVLGTVTPISTADAAHRRRISRFNRWLATYAAAESLPLVDYHAALVDPATGNLRAEYDSGDGTHPNAVGNARMASVWLDTLDRLLPPPSPLTAKSNTDPGNLVGNGLFLGDTDADGIANDWFTWGGVNSGTPTRSLVAATGVAGQVQRLTNAGVDGSHAVATNILSGWSVGDRLVVACLMTKTGGGPEAAIQLQNFGQNVGQGYRVAYVDWQVTAARGRISFDHVIGPGTTAVTVILQANGGTGSVDFGEVSVWNATTEQLL
jgi:lysophospholipase L1-like esterase